MNIDSKLFDVEEFFLSKSGIEKLNMEELIILDRLCKKIDVVKELYTFYTWDLSEKKSEQSVSLEIYNIFLKLLQMEESYDYKFINTSLKINDILLIKGLINDCEAVENNKKLIEKLKLLSLIENKGNNNENH